MKLLNAISLNMYNGDELFPLSKTISLQEAKMLLFPVHVETEHDRIGLGSRTRLENKTEMSKRDNCESCIGHAPTAKILSNLLDENIQPYRITVSLQENESIIVAQYIGPRLPEGTIQLPENSTINFFLIKMIKRKNYEKIVEVVNDFDQLAHKLAGWGSMMEMNDVEEILQKHFPKYFKSHAFD